MIKKDLAAKLAVNLKISLAEAERIIKAFTSAIIKGCKEDGGVVIMNFCSFKVKATKARIWHSIWTDQDQHIPQKNKIVFQPSISLKAMVNDELHEKEIPHHIGQPGHPANG